ncbi:MAG TPA: hypothetical protein VLL75_23305 [Vicinamibacteria bacterium]|nr:hypothetical protein [Vicinamibacteria bacterium]
MRILSVTVSAVLLAAGVEGAPSPWVEVKSGHFTVITNSGEKAGRRTAWQFEQIRSAPAQLWPWARIEAVKNGLDEDRRVGPVEAVGAQGREEGLLERQAQRLEVRRASSAQRG